MILSFKVVGGQQTDGKHFKIPSLALIELITGKSCGVFVFLAVVAFFSSTDLFLQSDVEYGRKLMAACLAQKVWPNLCKLQVCHFWMKYSFQDCDRSKVGRSGIMTRAWAPHSCLFIRRNWALPFGSITSTVRLIYICFNFVIVFTGFDDKQNEFHNLFRNFAANSISRALTFLEPILPTSPQWKAKLEAFNLKRESTNQQAAPTTTQTQGTKQPFEFSDDDASPPSKRPKTTTPPKQQKSTKKQQTLKQPQPSSRPTRAQPQSRPQRSVQTRKQTTKK